MKNKIFLLLAQLNFFYPWFLGIKFFQYKLFLKKNRLNYDNTQDLLELVNKSIDSIPYYRKLGIDKVNDIANFEKTMPFIDKDIIMENWDDFILPGLNKKLVIEGSTGGTSGKPLKLVIPKNRHIVELNTIFAMWKNVGWNGETRAVIRNAKLKPSEYFRVDPLRKEIIFDGFRTTDSYYKKVYETIIKYNLQFIHAYPSSAYQFALFLKKGSLDVSMIKAFFCGSEGLLPEQKELIQNQLGIKIYHWYGHSEKLVLGGFCSHNDLIHVEPTYGHFELIDENDEPITEPGEIGEIVGTTYHNPYMPLIRYRTGDFAEYAGDYCKDCGRHMTLLRKIYGRWDKNKIYRQDGSYITSTALNLHGEVYDKIDGLQYFQETAGKLEVRVIKGNKFKEETLRELQKHYQRAFGSNNTIEIKFVQKLEKLPNGKFQNLISKIET
jgi:phenylacetate-CoA ligase